MKIENLMSRRVHTCTPSDTLNAAANIMWEEDCGAVPVVDAAGHPVGLLTDRDIAMAAFFHGARLVELPVRQVMAKELATLRSTASIHDALELMREKQLRRVPVVDAAGVLVGMLTLADVARAWSRRLEVDGRELRDDDVAMTLAAISRSRHEGTRSVMVVEVTPQPRPLKAPAQATEAAKPARKSRSRGKAKKA